MSRTLILQSCPPDERSGTLRRCMESVRDWAIRRQFAYRWIGDELFAELPEAILAKTRDQPVIASDLGRLRRLQDALTDGYDTVVWMDADFLIFDPDRVDLPDTDCAVGREVWIQAGDDGKWQARKKVHNAFLMFRRQASGRHSSLDFYADAAERLLLANSGGMPPQFIGPKLLTALHNVVQWPVLEEAGMFSPPVIRDLLAGGGPALALLRRKSPVWPAAANLCRSSLRDGTLDEAQLEAVINRLLAGAPTATSRR